MKLREEWWRAALCAALSRYPAGSEENGKIRKGHHVPTNTGTLADRTEMEVLDVLSIYWAVGTWQTFVRRSGCPEVVGSTGWKVTNCGWKHNW